MKTKHNIELKHVSKTFGHQIVLNDLSFTVQKGERIALIGPSGAGKSTLLSIISNTLKPDSGDVYIDSLNLKEAINHKEMSKKVGIIRQQFDLVLPLKVINNVLVGRLRDWGFLKSLFSLFLHFDKQLALDTLRKVGIEDKAYEKTAFLSGGEQQRVALARVLVQSPEIILADEPIASLDPSRAQAIIELMLKLSKEHNHTLLVSLHAIDIALNHFDRIIALKDGHLMYDGKPKGLTEQCIKELYSLKENQTIA